MSLSSVTYTGNGVLATYSYANIDLLDDDLVTYASQLRVYVDNTLQVLNTAYTVSVINQNITFQAGYIPASNTVIKISRFTKSDDRYINYTNSTNITASILNTDAKQLFFLTQEAIDLRDDAMVLNNEDKWEGRGKTITNIGPASDATDAVNLGQLTAAITGTLPSTLGTKGYTTYTGDGSTTDYTLPSEAIGLAAKDIEIFVSGVKQSPTSAYTITGDTVSFSPALDNGVVAEVYYNKGTVPAAFGADAVTESMIQDRAVNNEKIDATGETTNHVLRVTNSPSGQVDWGTIPASTISDFDTQVRTSRLDQMATPTSDINLGSRKITNLDTPASNNDAANKVYVDTKAKVQQSTLLTANRTYSGITFLSGLGSYPIHGQKGTFTFSNLSTINSCNISIPIFTGMNGINNNSTAPSGKASIVYVNFDINFAAGVTYVVLSPDYVTYGLDTNNNFNSAVYGAFVCIATLTGNQIIFEIRKWNWNTNNYHLYWNGAVSGQSPQNPVYLLTYGTEPAWIATAIGT